MTKRLDLVEYAVNRQSTWVNKVTAGLRTAVQRPRTIEKQYNELQKEYVLDTALSAADRFLEKTKSSLFSMPQKYIEMLGEIAHEDAGRSYTILKYGEKNISDYAIYADAAAKLGSEYAKNGFTEDAKASLLNNICN